MLTITILALMVIWTLSGAAHAYAAYEEARYSRVVTELNEAAADYLRKHENLPDGADFNEYLTLK